MSVGRARRRRENFAVLCFRIQSKTVIFSGFGVILSAFLKGFQSFWNSKSWKFSAFGGPDKNTPPYARSANDKGGGILIWGVFLSGIPLITHSRSKSTRKLLKNTKTPLPVAEFTSIIIMKGVIWGLSWAGGQPTLDTQAKSSIKPANRFRHRQVYEGIKIVLPNMFWRNFFLKKRHDLNIATQQKLKYFVTKIKTGRQKTVFFSCPPSG